MVFSKVHSEVSFKIAGTGITKIIHKPCYSSALIRARPYLKLNALEYLTLFLDGPGWSSESMVSIH